ncbi:MAG: hypothetical protein GY853_02750 [PVC group bacterium]|nr:hypothetical protein [PVC group bacterium]
MKNLLNCKGLSFVEVIVSTLILASVLAAFFLVYSNASNMLSLAYHRAAALYWAQAEVERLKIHVRGAPAGIDDWQDEASGWPFGNVGTERDVTDGAIISYTMDGTGAPGPVNYYGGTFSWLETEKNGRIYQHIDTNNLTNNRGDRQITIQVRWTE